MILIVDDDIAVRTSLSLLFKQHGHKSDMAENPKEAFAKLEKQAYDLVILDMNFTVETTGDEGLATLKEMKQKHPALPVILITGWGHMVIAIEGMKLGAADFLNKPWENQHVMQTVETVLKLSEQGQVKSLSRQKLDKQYDFSGIIGHDPQLLRVLETIGRVAQTDAPILILGESGTGKEMIAEALHRNSKRQKGPFVKVNLGGISQSLFESEMFGHKKGAFTNAYTDRKGRFEMADKGTIFLDEMGELDLSSQVKMLRVLQDRRFEVLGSSETKKVDVRVISATNRSLEQMVKEERFREDLFYRINLITVHLPALRERKEDIPLLAEYFLQTLRESYGRPALSIQKEAMEWLKNQPFLGNIRELKNLVESTVLMSPHDQLSLKDFNQRNAVAQPAPAPQTAPLDPSGMTLEEMEVKLIEKTLKEHKYKVAPAARALGISRNALYRRMDKHHIDYDPES